MKTKYGVGLMSGTSLDGIDAALVSIDASKNMNLIAFETLAMADDLKERLKDAMALNKSNCKLICSLNFELGYGFAHAVKSLCQKCGFDLGKLDFIASPGQTIYHMPTEENGYYKSTLQLGEPSVIAYETQRPVISNFRSMDMAAGGEGAPLVPYFDYVYFKNMGPLCLLNIGGISNVTIILKDASIEDVLAFDTGPGNMVINTLMKRFYNLPYDEGGKIAQNGRVDKALLEKLLEDPYVKRLPPKSTGRERYGEAFVDALLKNSDLSKEDLVATLTMFSALSITNNLKAYDLDMLLVSGGGVHNKTLMGHIQASFPGQVLSIDTHGIDPNAKEAMAFALIAYETLCKRPSNVPSATGAKKYVIQGSITYP